MSRRRFSLAFDCNNAAFEDEGLEHAIASILRRVAHSVDADALIASPDQEFVVEPVRDPNGTTIGHWSYQAQPDPEPEPEPSLAQLQASRDELDELEEAARRSEGAAIRGVDPDD
jgi:hypothetical protein